MNAFANPVLPAVRWKNILYTTDFSEASRAAIPFVAALARKYGSKCLPCTFGHHCLIPWFHLEQARSLRRRRKATHARHWLREYCPELWFRSIVECGRTYSWRVTELLKLKVSQVDTVHRVIRLETGTTKNIAGLEVLMTEAVFQLFSLY